MRRKVLLLGGTGPMGRHCQEVLDDGNTDIVVTSRSEHASDNNSIKFVHGDAMDLNFLKSVLENNRFNAIVDFMLYSADIFAGRVELFLHSTDQYIFMSSARVYAGQEKPISEDDPLLLDISTDREYLQTHEYALEKAKCENILRASPTLNYTIIRPYITYGDYRLQLGVLEKENWLYRALHGRSIVFSEDIANKKTTMTFGKDVAVGISSLVGNKAACGEIFNITYKNSYTWKEILKTYLKSLKKYGIEPKVVYSQKATSLKFPQNRYQVIYCRYFDRCFDNKKIGRFADINSFTNTMTGIDDCLCRFLEKPKFATINWIYEAFLDKVAHEFTPLSEIEGISMKIRYLIARFTFYYELRLRVQKWVNLLKGLNKG